MNAGSGGAVLASDDVGGFQVPRGKIAHGIDGVNDGDVALTNPFPVVAALRPMALSDGTTTLIAPLFAIVDHATAGDNTIVAATASKKITVLSYVLVASGGANTVRWESAASGTAKSGQMDIVSDGQLVASGGGVPLFQCGTNELLNLELSASTSVDGHITYCLLP